jgi:hypothetical protein
MRALDTQQTPGIEIRVTDGSEHPTIGEARNFAVARSAGEYSVFFDDDDLPEDDYTRLISGALSHKPDCVGIRKNWYENGVFKGIATHSLRFTANARRQIRDGVWEFDRQINHLCPMRTDFFRAIPFEPMNRCEDVIFSDQLRESGLVKNSIEIEKPIYNYWYRTEALRNHLDPFDVRSLGMSDDVKVESANHP